MCICLLDSKKRERKGKNKINRFARIAGFSLGSFRVIAHRDKVTRTLSHSPLILLACETILKRYHLCLGTIFLFLPYFLLTKLLDLVTIYQHHFQID